MRQQHQLEVTYGASQGLLRTADPSILAAILTSSEPECSLEPRTVPDGRCPRSFIAEVL